MNGNNRRRGSAHALEDRAQAQTSSAVKKHRHKHNIKRRYEVLETLGKGTYGKVKRAVERQCGNTVSRIHVKLMNKINKKYE